MTPIPTTSRPRPSSPGSSPLRIALAYVAFGMLWIWISDEVVWRLLDGRDGFLVSGLKGTVFVLLSALLVHYLVQRHTRQVSRTGRLLQAIADGTSDAIFVKDRDGRYLLFNSAAGEFVGHDPEKVIGKDDGELFDPEGAEFIRARDRRVMDGGIVETAEEVLTAAGVTRTYLATKGPYRDETGQVIGVLGISRDITDRKRVEAELVTARREAERNLAELVRSESRLRILIERMPSAMVVFTNQRLTFCNPAFLRITGASRMESVLGRTPAEVFSAEHRAMLEEQLANLDSQAVPSREIEARIVRLDGHDVPVSISTIPFREDDRVSTLVVLTDLSERHRLENEFRQAQKLEAIGRLAGGVAHDFNNLLTVILSYCEILLEDEERSSEQRQAVEAVRFAARRAADLTGQLLTFSRKAIATPRIVNPNELVTDVGKMMRRLIGEDIVIVTQLAPDIGRIRIDPGFFGQVLMNLAVNARDAMPSGGTLTIRTSNVSVTNQDSGFGTECPLGDYVAVEVEDTGTGMPPEVRARIFEPFFTTKAFGHGTGLGLATVFGIVTQAGGHISVDTAPGKGTRFHVLFPGRPEVRSEPTPFASPAPTRGKETILIVEDEDAVRRIAVHALENQGYRVLSAPSGKEALALSAGHVGRIDLILTDVVMPGMNGNALCDELRRTRPALRRLFMSGYSDEAVLREAGNTTPATVLQKPFTPAELSRAVRDVLDAAG